MKLFKLMVLLSPLLLASCGSQKHIDSSNVLYEEDTSAFTPEVETNEEIEPVTAIEENLETPQIEEKSLISRIADYAREFLGTAYKYGGTTIAGMDCSGLVYTAFSREQIDLPRTSRDMALLGEQLHLEEVNLGDLLFFETNRRKKVINHVGLVVDIAEQGIFFIHSTISRGVIISSLSEKYWQDHFVMARRIQ